MRWLFITIQTSCAGYYMYMASTHIGSLSCFLYLLAVVFNLTLTLSWIGKNK